jgi:hypothetical protein
MSTAVSISGSEVLASGEQRDLLAPPQPVKSPGHKSVLSSKPPPLKSVVLRRLPVASPQEFQAALRRIDGARYASACSARLSSPLLCCVERSSARNRLFRYAASYGMGACPIYHFVVQISFVWPNTSPLRCAALNWFDLMPRLTSAYVLELIDWWVSQS